MLEHSACSTSHPYRGHSVLVDSLRTLLQEVEVKVLRWLHEEEATGIQYLEVHASCSQHQPICP